LSILHTKVVIPKKYKSIHKNLEELYENDSLKNKNIQKIKATGENINL
jgi:hypothetical protein